MGALFLSISGEEVKQMEGSALAFSVGGSSSSAAVAPGSAAEVVTSDVPVPVAKDALIETPKKSFDEAATSPDSSPKDGSIELNRPLRRRRLRRREHRQIKDVVVPDNIAEKTPNASITLTDAVGPDCIAEKTPNVSTSTLADEAATSAADASKSSDSGLGNAEKAPDLPESGHEAATSAADASKSSDSGLGNAEKAPDLPESGHEVVASAADASKSGGSMIDNAVLPECIAEKPPNASISTSNDEDDVLQQRLERLCRDEDVAAAPDVSGCCIAEEVPNADEQDNSAIESGGEGVSSAAEGSHTFSPGCLVEESTDDVWRNPLESGDEVVTSAAEASKSSDSRLGNTVLPDGIAEESPDVIIRDSLNSGDEVVSSSADTWKASDSMQDNVAKLDRIAEEAPNATNLSSPDVILRRVLETQTDSGDEVFPSSTDARKSSDSMQNNMAKLDTIAEEAPNATNSSSPDVILRRVLETQTDSGDEVTTPAVDVSVPPAVPAMTAENASRSSDSRQRQKRPRQTNIKAGRQPRRRKRQRRPRQRTIKQGKANLRNGNAKNTSGLSAVADSFEKPAGNVDEVGLAKDASNSNDSRLSTAALLCNEVLRDLFALETPNSAASDVAKGVDEADPSTIDVSDLAVIPGTSAEDASKSSDSRLCKAVLLCNEVLRDCIAKKTTITDVGLLDSFAMLANNVDEVNRYTPPERDHSHACDSAAEDRTPILQRTHSTDSFHVFSPSLRLKVEPELHAVTEVNRGTSPENVRTLRLRRSRSVDPSRASHAVSEVRGISPENRRTLRSRRTRSVDPCLASRAVSEVNRGTSSAAARKRARSVDPSRISISSGGMLSSVDSKLGAAHEVSRGTSSSTARKRARSVDPSRVSISSGGMLSSVGSKLGAAHEVNRDTSPDGDSAAMGSSPISKRTRARNSSPLSTPSGDVVSNIGFKMQVVSEASDEEDDKVLLKNGAKNGMPFGVSKYPFGYRATFRGTHLGCFKTMAEAAKIVAGEISKTGAQLHRRGRRVTSVKMNGPKLGRSSPGNDDQHEDLQVFSASPTSGIKARGRSLSRVHSRPRIQDEEEDVNVLDLGRRARNETKAQRSDHATSGPMTKREQRSDHDQPNKSKFRRLGSNLSGLQAGSPRDLDSDEDTAADCAANSDEPLAQKGSSPRQLAKDANHVDLLFARRSTADEEARLGIRLAAIEQRSVQNSEVCKVLDTWAGIRNPDSSNVFGLGPDAKLTEETALYPNVATLLCRWLQDNQKKRIYFTTVTATNSCWKGRGDANFVLKAENKDKKNWKLYFTTISKIEDVKLGVLHEARQLGFMFPPFPELEALPGCSAPQEDPRRNSGVAGDTSTSCSLSNVELPPGGLGNLDNLSLDLVGKINASVAQAVRDRDLLLVECKKLLEGNIALQAQLRDPAGRRDSVADLATPMKQQRNMDSCRVKTRSISMAKGSSISDVQALPRSNDGEHSQLALTDQAAGDAEEPRRVSDASEDLDESEVRKTVARCEEGIGQLAKLAANLRSKIASPRLCANVPDVQPVAVENRSSSTFSLTSIDFSAVQAREVTTVDSAEANDESVKPLSSLLRDVVGVRITSSTKRIATRSVSRAMKMGQVSGMNMPVVSPRRTRQLARGNKFASKRFRNGGRKQSTGSLRKEDTKNKPVSARETRAARRENQKQAWAKPMDKVSISEDESCSSGPKTNIANEPPPQPETAGRSGRGRAGRTRRTA